jgi:hypothetical protein
MINKFIKCEINSKDNENKNEIILWKINSINKNKKNK